MAAHWTQRTIALPPYKRGCHLVTHKVHVSSLSLSLSIIQLFFDVLVESIESKSLKLRVFCSVGRILNGSSSAYLRISVCAFLIKCSMHHHVSTYLMHAYIFLITTKKQ